MPDDEEQTTETPEPSEKQERKPEPKKARLSATIPVWLKKKVEDNVKDEAFASASEFATIAFTYFLAVLESEKEIAKLQEQVDVLQARLKDLESKKERPTTKRKHK